jgi:hypothetical protein
MGFVPLLFLVGLVELIVAVACANSAWPRHVAFRLGLIAAAVMVLSFAAGLQAITYQMMFSCD